MSYEDLSNRRAARRMEALEICTDRFTYNPDDGVITRNRDGVVMDNVADCGAVILPSKHRSVTAGQFVWFWKTGTDPNERGSFINFFDKNPANHHHQNLRRFLFARLECASNANNEFSELVGVSFDKKRQKFYAQFSLGGKNYRVKGLFDTALEAARARSEALEDHLKECYEDFPTTIDELLK